MISIYYLIKFSCCSAETKYRCQNDTINLNVSHIFDRLKLWRYVQCPWLHVQTPNQASFPVFMDRTLKAHDAAHDHDVSRTPLLHVRHHFFDHADDTEEVGLKHFLHLLDADALHRSQQAHAGVVDWRETHEHTDDALLVPPNTTDIKTFEWSWRLDMKWYIWVVHAVLLAFPQK